MIQGKKCEGGIFAFATDLRTVEQSCKAQELSAQEVLATAPPRCNQQDDITTSQDRPRVSRCAGMRQEGAAQQNRRKEDAGSKDSCLLSKVIVSEEMGKEIGENLTKFGSLGRSECAFAEFSAPNQGRRQLCEAHLPCR